MLSIPELHHQASEQTNKPVDPHSTEVSSLEDAIKVHIQRALQLCEGQIHGQGGAAELLNINPNTLRSRMRKLGIPFK